MSGLERPNKMTGQRDDNGQVKKYVRKRANKLYPFNAPCPCGSEIIYRDCCKSKKFRFEINPKGEVVRSLKIHPRLKARLQSIQKEFQTIFGREPSGKDPVLFSQHLHSESEFWQQAKQVGRSASVREELIFAWRRSGFIVGEHSRSIMPDCDYAEWEDAIDEYFLLKEQGHDPFYVFTYLNGAEYEEYKRLVGLIDHAIIVMGFSISNWKRKPDLAGFFACSLIDRAMRSLRTIREMYANRYDDDCLAIARSIYEVYLRLIFLRKDPSSGQRFEAIVAHELGFFPNKLKKNGQPDYGICVDPETGAEFNLVLSNRQMLNLSDSKLDAAIYYDLYPILSGQVHPETTHNIINAFHNDSANNENVQDPIRAIIFILSICFLLLAEIAKSPMLPRRTVRDINHVSKQMYHSLQRFLVSETLLARRTTPTSLYALFGLSVSPVPSA